MLYLSVEADPIEEDPLSHDIFDCLHRIDSSDLAPLQAEDLKYLVNLNGSLMESDTLEVVFVPYLKEQ